MMEAQHASCGEQPGPSLLTQKRLVVGDNRGGGDICWGKGGKERKPTGERFRFLGIQPIEPAKTPLRAFHGPIRLMYVRVGLKERTRGPEYDPT